MEQGHPTYIRHPPLKNYSPRISRPGISPQCEHAPGVHQPATYQRINLPLHVPARQLAHLLIKQSTYLCMVQPDAISASTHAAESRWRLFWWETFSFDDRQTIVFVIVAAGWHREESPRSNHQGRRCCCSCCCCCWSCFSGWQRRNSTRGRAIEFGS